MFVLGIQQPISTQKLLLVRPYVQLGANYNETGRLSLMWQGEMDSKSLKLFVGNSKKFVEAPFESKEIRIEGTKPFRVFTAILAKNARNYKLQFDGKWIDRGEIPRIPTSSGSFTFAVVGDIGRNTEEEAKVAYQISRSKPQMAVLTGDIVYNDGYLSEYRKNFYPYYSASNPDPRIGAPILQSCLTIPVAGNHDISDADFEKEPDALGYYYLWQNPLNGPMRRGPKSIPRLKGGASLQTFLSQAGPNYPRQSIYSFDYGNSHWTILDSNEYMDWGDEDLLKWLRDDLAKARKQTWRFVSFHHPGFHSSKKHQDQKHMRALHEIFQKYHVQVVFSGHVHNYQRTKPIIDGPANLIEDGWKLGKIDNSGRANGVIYVVEGGGGAYLYNPELNTRPTLWKPFTAEYSATYSFGLVRIEGSSLSFTQVDQNGRKINKFSLKAR